MSGSDGNLSALLNADEVLITPSRLSKGYLEPFQIVKVDRDGKKLDGDLPPSVELTMHLMAYNVRPDIRAVAHCHPPMLTAFTVAGMTLPAGIIPEMEVMFLGELPVAPYATPAGPDLAESIRDLVVHKNVIILDHHGVLSVGLDIFQAGIKIEHAEAAAKVIYYSRMLGGEKPLPENRLQELAEIHERINQSEREIFST
jgi:L-fuculose-phosphate aldolase